MRTCKKAVKGLSPSRQSTRSVGLSRGERAPLGIEIPESRTLLNGGALDPVFGSAGKITAVPVGPVRF
jgi:hypothetical protein